MILLFYPSAFQSRPLPMSYVSKKEHQKKTPAFLLVLGKLLFFQIPRPLSMKHSVLTCLDNLPWDWGTLDLDSFLVHPGGRGNCQPRDAQQVTVVWDLRLLQAPNFRKAP